MIKYKNIILSFVFLLVLTLLTFILNFILCPISYTNMIFTGYRELKNKNLDVLFLGSSQMQECVNSEYISTITKLNCFSFAVPYGNFFSDRIILQNVLKKSKVEKIFIDYDILPMFSDNNTDKVSYREMPALFHSEKNIFKKITFLKYMKDVSYTKIFFNFANYHTFKGIKDTLKTKLTKEYFSDIVIQSKKQKKGFPYLGRGNFGLNSPEKNSSKLNQSKMFKDSMNETYSDFLPIKYQKELIKFISVCKINKIPVTVVIMPHPSITRNGIKNWNNIIKNSKNFFEYNNISFLDLSSNQCFLDKSENDKQFEDFMGHLRIPYNLEVSDSLIKYF